MTLNLAIVNPSTSVQQRPVHSNGKLLPQTPKTKTSVQPEFPPQISAKLTKDIGRPDFGEPPFFITTKEIQCLSAFLRALMLNQRPVLPVEDPPTGQKARMNQAVRFQKIAQGPMADYYLRGKEWEEIASQTGEEPDAVRMKVTRSEGVLGTLVRELKLVDRSINKYDLTNSIGSSHGTGVLDLMRKEVYGLSESDQEWFKIVEDWSTFPYTTPPAHKFDLTNKTDSSSGRLLKRLGIIPPSGIKGEIVPVEDHDCNILIIRNDKEEIIRSWIIGKKSYPCYEQPDFSILDAQSHHTKSNALFRLALGVLDLPIDIQGALEPKRVMKLNNDSKGNSPKHIELNPSYVTSGPSGTIVVPGTYLGDYLVPTVNPGERTVIFCEPLKECREKPDTRKPVMSVTFFQDGENNWKYQTDYLGEHSVQGHGPTNKPAQDIKRFFRGERLTPPNIDLVRVRNGTSGKLAILGSPPLYVPEDFPFELAHPAPVQVSNQIHLGIWRPGVNHSQVTPDYLYTLEIDNKFRLIS